MKHILYDMGFYFLWFMKTIYIQTQRTQWILESILNSLNNVSKGKQRGGVGHNWEKYLLGYFMFQSI